MAIPVSSRRVNTVAGNRRFRILRGISDNANDTLAAGGGRVVFSKPTPVNGSDPNVGVARNSATVAVDMPGAVVGASSNAPGSVFFTGVVPTTVIYAYAVIGVG